MADRSPAALRDALRVYLVTPDAWGTRAEDVTITEGLLRAGLRVVQFRDKSAAPRQRERAQQLQALCHAHGALFLVNDDPNLALELDADGVHVGASDASVREARAILGPDKIVGATAGALARALRALEEGADYLGVGAIFDAAPSKADAQTRGPAILRALREEPLLHAFPIVAIGGIDTSNAGECFAAGADGVAMIRGLWHAKDPESTIAALRAPLS